MGDVNLKIQLGGFSNGGTVERCQACVIVIFILRKEVKSFVDQYSLSTPSLIPGA